MATAKRKAERDPKRMVHQISLIEYADRERNFPSKAIVSFGGPGRT